MFDWVRKLGRRPRRARTIRIRDIDRRARRCPLNVAGPFYSTGNCLACGAPEGEAPGLLAELTPDNATTYFVRQPQTPEEVERACRAMRVCCVEDLRYAGTDLAIIERLGNDERYCDHVMRDGQLVRSDRAPED